LREDHSGSLIDAIAKLAFDCFREPPWSDDHSLPRLHFGLGVDLMCRNAAAFLARDGSAGSVAGYSVGFEVFETSQDPRDPTLEAISGTAGLNHLFEGGKRLFYWDTLCVDPRFRRQRIAIRLARATMECLPEQGLSLLIARTDRAALPMRRLLQRLKFRELPVPDRRYPSRTYWLLEV